MKTLTADQIQSLATWINTNLESNWGTWGQHPSLPVAASYLQYDTNKMQINLDEPIHIPGVGTFQVITHSRGVVGKNWELKDRAYASDIVELVFGKPEPRAFNVSPEEVTALIIWREADFKEVAPEVYAIVKSVKIREKVGWNLLQHHARSI